MSTSVTLTFTERETVRCIVQELLETLVIQESSSYASPILLVKKKTGEQPMCVDFRTLNAKTVKDRYPLPRADNHFHRLKGNHFFTSLDLVSGYHQIPLSAESVPKTAFITPDGHYEYFRIPFGLANAPAVFQRTINKILDPLRFVTALAYMDDILIPSADISSGMAALRDVLILLRQAHLAIWVTK